MRKILYTLLGFFVLTKSYANDNCPLGICRLDDSQLKNGDADLITSADNIVGYLVGLLYFVAVVVGIYGGVLILVSGGDEEKVKKGKNYLVYMVIGLIVIFLASIIVNWVIDVMTRTNITG